MSYHLIGDVRKIMSIQLKQLSSELKAQSTDCRLGANNVEIFVPQENVHLVKALIDLLADDCGFETAITEKSIRISDIDHLEDDLISEIADVILKGAGTRMNLGPKPRMVQQNKPAMGYPKNGGLTAVSSKYNCMVSGQKRMDPCAGCGNPKGCLSGAMQFKKANK